MKHSQRGYSLIELSIVLAIVAVIIAGAVSGVQAILRSNNVVNTISDSNKSVNRIISKLVRDNTYANATIQVMTSPGMDVWDSKYVANGGTATATISNSFGGRVFVAPLGADSNGILSGQGFIYTLTGIPAAACTDVVLGLDGLGVGIAVMNELSTAAAIKTDLTGGTTVKRPGTPLSSNTVATACNVATGQASISVLVARS